MSLPFKLISTDFDGTLFAEFESPPIPIHLENLIGDLQRQGVKWAINTGRDMSSLMESLARAGIGIEPDYLVLVEREIHIHQDSQYVSLHEWNSRCESAHAGLFKTIRQDLPRIIDWVNSRFHARIYEDAYSPFCLIASNNGDADVIHDYLEQYARGLPQLAVVRNDVYARFSHVDFNKGTALAELTRRLGLTAAQVFAAGDHLNDLPMLSAKYAGFLAAPGNAIPAVKHAVQQQRGFISELTQGNGVAEAIKFYLEDHLS
jgi:HAD superfamily hydrolase (TIGR01484 family)